MHRIEIQEKSLVPEGSLFCVVVGCQTFSCTDKEFVTTWLTKYLKDPKATENEWNDQPWSQNGKEPGAESAQYTAATEAAQRNLAEAYAAPRGLGATLGRR